jgi:hypothetical protein
LVVVERHWEAGFWALYSIAGNALVSLHSPYANGVVAWSSDSQRIVFTSSELMGDNCDDLLKFDVSAQVGSVLNACQFSDPGYSNSGWPWLTPSGDLLYFYNHAANTDGFDSGHPPPWLIVRGKLDDPATPVPIRMELPTDIDEVLWGPDGAIAVISQGNAGPVVWVPIDAAQPIQVLVPVGTNLRWGP